MGSGRVKSDLTDLPRGPRDPRNRFEVLRDPLLSAPTFEFGSFDFPYEDLTVLAA